MRLTVLLASIGIRQPPKKHRSMTEYSFEVGVRAVVRVQASDPDAARKVVESVLRAPGSQEIELANRNNQGRGRDATVTAVDFVQKTPAKLVADQKKRPTSA